MLDLGTSSASLASWYYQPLTKMCQASSLPAYLRDVDFSPDGSKVVFDAFTISERFESISFDDSVMYKNIFSRIIH